MFGAFAVMTVYLNTRASNSARDEWARSVCVSLLSLLLGLVEAKPCLAKGIAR